MQYLFGKRGMRGVVSLGLLFFFCLIGTNVHASFGAVGGRPAFPREDNQRTKSISVHTIEPGQTIEEGVKVVNTSDEEKNVTVAAVDSLVSSGGAFGCEQNGETKDEVGSWITLEQTSVTLGPRSEKVIPFTIAAPENAGVGEHNGCITIQEKNQQKQNAGQGISLSFRTGLRVALLVPGDVKRELTVAGFRADENSSGGTILIPSIENLGNVSIDADVKVETKTLFGKQYQVNGGQYPILRGEISEFAFELERPFWGGWYQATLEVIYDQSTELELGEEPTGELTKIYGQPVTVFFWPTLNALLIEIAIGFVLVFIALVVLKLVKKKKWIATTWVEYKVRAGDDIEKIAAKVEISWKVLARANKLQAPYKLKTGDIIKVPPHENLKKRTLRKRASSPRPKSKSNAAKVTKATTTAKKKTSSKRTKK